MKRIGFYLAIDVPTALVLYSIFCFHFRYWSSHAKFETPVNLKSRLSVAIARVTLLFLVFVLLCWIVDLAVWFVFLLVLLAGIFFCFTSLGNFPAEMLIFASAFLIREWCFDFPNLILTPAADPSDSDDPSTSSQWVGKSGRTTSPLRPAGDIELAGKTFSAISEDGRFVEKDLEIFVTEMRHGRAKVTPVKESNRPARPDSN